LVKYGIDVLKTMGDYLLHRLGLRTPPYMDFEGATTGKGVPSVSM
jgi:hypothetical protein